VIAAGVLLPLIINEANKPAPPQVTDEIEQDTSAAQEEVV
jgi:hypothetical protein